jgi:Tol biopolymer transport system component
MFNRKIDLYQKPANGAGAEGLVLSTPTTKNPTSWSRDGRFVLYYTSEPNPSLDLWVLPLSGETVPVVETNFDERDGQFSPDGRWIAFESN